MIVDDVNILLNHSSDCTLHTQTPETKTNEEDEGLSFLSEFLQIIARTRINYRYILYC